EAHLVHAVRGGGPADPGAERGLPGGVLAGAGRQHLPHDHGVHRGRVDPAALERPLDRARTQLRGGEGGQRPLEPALGGASSGDDDDLGHGCLPAVTAVSAVIVPHPPRTGRPGSGAVGPGDCSGRGTGGQGVERDCTRTSTRGTSGAGRSGSAPTAVSPRGSVSSAAAPDTARWTVRWTSSTMRRTGSGPSTPISTVTSPLSRSTTSP